ncbi:MAG TPA: type II toxin-antitoxin system prevent-host-death family antitoxin [Rhizomicrobium sp.]|jgi:prevent-host-death family protein
MRTIKIHDAKTNLSRLIARAEAGEEIVIARDDEPVAKLIGIGNRPHDAESGFGFAEDAAPYEQLPAASRARITVDPEVCGGRPCIRGMRIRVSDVVGLLAAGEKRERILKDYPYLESADIDAALAYAAGAVNHRVIRTG